MKREREDESGTTVTVNPVPGLNLLRDWLTEDEERSLLEHIDASTWNTTLKRRTQHYGYEYKYAGGSVTTTADPIPDWITPYINRLVEQGILVDAPDQVIINEYHPGQGIAPHTDNTHLFADGIVSVSLGSDIVMDFTLTNGTAIAMTLPRRSMLSLHKDARYKWKHGIAHRYTDGGKARGRRVSLTFRTMIKK